MKRYLLLGLLTGIFFSCSSESRYILLHKTAYTLYLSGDFEGAVSAYQTLLEENPDDFRAIYGLANSRRELMKRQLNIASAAGKADRPQLVLTAISRALQELNMAERLLLKAKQLARTKEEKYEVYYGLGVLFYEIALFPGELYGKEFAERRDKAAELAIINFREALKFMSNSPSAHRYLGLLLFIRGDFKEALPYLKYYVSVLRETLEKQKVSLIKSYGPNFEDLSYVSMIDEYKNRKQELEDFEAFIKHAEASQP